MKSLLLIPLSLALILAFLMIVSGAKAALPQNGPVIDIPAAESLYRPQKLPKGMQQLPDGTVIIDVNIVMPAVAHGLKKGINGMVTGLKAVNETAKAVKKVSDGLKRTDTAVQNASRFLRWLKSLSNTDAQPKARPGLEHAP